MRVMVGDTVLRNSICAAPASVKSNFSSKLDWTHPMIEYRILEHIALFGELLKPGDWKQLSDHHAIGSLDLRAAQHYIKIGVLELRFKKDE